MPPILRGNVVFSPMGEATFHAVRLDPNRPKAPGLSAEAVPIRWPGTAWVIGGGVLLLGVVVLLRRKWRAMIVMVSMLLGGTALWGWATSYTTTQFIGQMRRTGAGPHAALLTRGVTSRDGSLTFASRHTVWDSAISLNRPRQQHLRRMVD